MCKLAQSMLSQAVAIRGLSQRSDVPCIVSSRADVEKFLHEMIATQLPPAKIEMEELLYKTIGLIPQSFDYKKGLIDLYVSQIGGYYDPEKKRFVMADWIPSEAQASVAVHELTHALQDQHFDLKQMLDPKQENGDKLLAHSAISEGDAMLVMNDYERAVRRQPVVNEAVSIAAKSVQLNSESEALRSSTGEAVPEALRAILLFPYTSGVHFMKTALGRGKNYSGADLVFQNPPTSTREILHPDVYWDSKALKPSVPTISELQAENKQSRVVYSDVLGEFLIQLVLCADKQGRTGCEVAAQGWIGDRIAVVDSGGGVQEVIWLTRWESPQDAHEFALAYSAKSTGGQPVGPVAMGETPASAGSKVPHITKVGNEVLITFRALAAS